MSSPTRPDADIKEGRRPKLPIDLPRDSYGIFIQMFERCTHIVPTKRPTVYDLHKELKMLKDKRADRN